MCCYYFCITKNLSNVFLKSLRLFPKLFWQMFHYARSLFFLSIPAVNFVVLLRFRHPVDIGTVVGHFIEFVFTTRSSQFAVIFCRRERIINNWNKKDDRAEKRLINHLFVIDDESTRARWHTSIWRELTLMTEVCWFYLIKNCVVLLL